MKEDNKNIRNKKEITIKPRFVLQVFLSRVMIPYIILFVIDALDSEIDDGYLDTNFYVIVTIMTAILAGMLLPFRKAILRNTSYTFNQDGITCNKDFPVKVQKTIKYSNIKNIFVKQNWVQKIYGTGTLLLATNDNSGTHCFFSLDKVMDVQTLIKEMRNKVTQ